MVRLGKPSTNLLWQEHLDEVPVVAAFDQAKRTTIDKATQGSTNSVTANTDAFGEPQLREAQTMPAFEPSVTKKMRIGGAVDHVETQVGHDKIIQLFPHVCRIRHFPFHDGCPAMRNTGDGAREVGAGKIRGDTPRRGGRSGRVGEAKNKKGEMCSRTLA